MKRFVWLTAIIAALTITLAAQQAKDPNAKIALKDGEKCTDVGGCTCAGTATPNGCTCSISGGTGTVSCPVSGLGSLGSGLLILVGVLIGSGLTFIVMRRRVTSP